MQMTAQQFRTMHAAGKINKARGRKRRVPGEMNSTELRYSQHLDTRLAVGEILWYRFEAVKLRLADKTYYSSDFAAMLPCGQIELHEVKGTTKRKDSSGVKQPKPFIEDDAAVKIKVAAEQYWMFVFKLVFFVKGEGWRVKEY